MTSEIRRLILPGLLPADPSREKYWVRPGGVTVFMLNPDDRMTLVDVDGAQAAEITILDAEGHDDSAAIGARADSSATVLRGVAQPISSKRRPRLPGCRSRTGEGSAALR